MFNFKKAICIIKKSVSVMMSAVLCLNLCSFFVYATGDDDLAKVGILGDDNSRKDVLLTKLRGVERLWREHYNDLPQLSTKDFYDDLSDIDLVLLAVPYNGGNKKENYVKYLHRYLYRLQEAKYRGKVKIVLTQSGSLSELDRNTVRTAVTNVLSRTLKRYYLPFTLESVYIGYEADEADDADDADIVDLYCYLRSFQRNSLKEQRKRLQKPSKKQRKKSPKKVPPGLPSSLLEYFKDLGYDEPAPSDKGHKDDQPPEQVSQGGKDDVGVPKVLPLVSRVDSTNVDSDFEKGDGGARETDSEIKDDLPPEQVSQGTEDDVDSDFGEEYGGVRETGFEAEALGRANRGRHLTKGQIAGISAIGTAVVGVGVAAFTLFNKLTHHK